MVTLLPLTSEIGVRFPVRPQLAKPVVACGWSAVYCTDTVGVKVLYCKLPTNGLFVYLGFYVAFNTVQVISQRVVGRAEETSTYSSLGFCTVHCRPTASNYQLSHLRP